MSGRIEVKERDIQRMGDPGKWMPVALVKRRRRPVNRLPVHAGLQMRIVKDVARIVVIDETVVKRREIDRNGCNSKQQTKGNWARQNVQGGRNKRWRLRNHG